MINTGGGQRLLLTTNVGCHVFCSKFAEEKNPVKIAVARRPLLARLKRARIRGNEGSADSCLPSLLC